MCNRFDVFVLKQSFVITSSFLHSLTISLILTFPAALNPSLLSPNGTDIMATADQASWLTASNGISGFMGKLLLSSIMQLLGRKPVQIVMNAIVIVGWVIFIFAKTITDLFAARTIQGFSLGGLFIGTIMVSEYSHPARRGYFTAIKRAFSVFGALLCHSLTLCCTWRQIAAVALVPAFVSLIIAIFSPESPAYLAMKGRFEESEKSFLWLHGDSLDSRKELQEMISAQKHSQEIKLAKKKCTNFWMEFIGSIRDKGFVKALLIVSVLMLVVDACGKYYFVVYIIEIMIEITGDKSIAVYCSIGGDCLGIVALIAAFFLIGHFNRRSLMLGCGGIAIVLMFSLGLLQLLNSYDIIKWIIGSIILLQYFVINLGVIPVCFSIFGEIIPLEQRGIGSCFAGLVFSVFYIATMKLTPVLMTTTGIAGTYGIYGLCLLICFIVLYFILPETKDMTLQQIEDNIKGIRNTVIEIKPMLLKVRNA